MSARECGVCGRASGDGAPLPGWCPRCRGTTVADVADLPVLYRALHGVLTPGQAGERQRVGGSRTPPLPLRVDVANLRGPAGVGVIDAPDQIGAPSIATVLWCARQTVRETCGLPAELLGSTATHTDTRVRVDAHFLTVWLDRYAERAEPGDLAGLVEQLHATRGRAWRAAGYAAHKVCLGPCPAAWDDGQTCGTQLWADPVTDDGVRCRLCGTRYDRRYFLWLRRQAQEVTA